MARLSLGLTGEGVRLGDDGLPRDILLWRDGITKTTKGTFKLTDRARKMVMDDWTARMGGVVSPSGDGPGSFDYDHDEFNEHLPGRDKDSAGSFHLTLEGKDLWLTGCCFTSEAAEKIRAKKKRSTSGAFYFDPKTGEFTSLINVGLTNLPATYNQPLLASGHGRQGMGIVFSPPDGPENERRTIVQVPAIVLPGTLSDSSQQALSSAVDALGRGDLAAAGRALLAGQPTDTAVTSLPDGKTDTAPNDITKPNKEPNKQKDVGVVPHGRYRLVCTDAWVRDEASKRVQQWASLDGSGDWDKIDPAKLALAYAYVRGRGESIGDFLLLHHDVDNHGELVTVDGGVDEACHDFAAMMAIDSQDIPREEWPAVKHHLAMHEHEFGEKAPWESGAETSATKRQPMTTQTLILSKDRFKSLPDAQAWCKKHGFKSGVDETTNSYRFRQREPSDFADGSLRTIKLDKGIDAVVGHLKGAHSQAPQTTSQRTGMYSDMNPHSLVGARLRHLGEAFPMMHMLKRHASAAGHDDLVKHYGEHMERMGKHAEHLVKHAKMLGDTMPGLPAEKLSGADLPGHLSEMHPHHLMRHKMEHTADGMVMDAHLKHLSKLGAMAEMAEGYHEHMGHKGEHLKHLAEHMMQHAADARTLSCLDGKPSDALAQVVAILGVAGADDVLPALIDQKAMLEQAQKTALSALTTTGADVAAARLAKITAMQLANILSPVDSQLAQGINPASGKPGLQPWTLAQLDAIEKKAQARLSSGGAGQTVIDGQTLTPTPSATPTPQQGAVAKASAIAGNPDQLAMLRAMNPSKSEAEVLAMLESTKSIPRGPMGSGESDEE